jgi:hypothetical protein
MCCQSDSGFSRRLQFFLMRQFRQRAAHRFPGQARIRVHDFGERQAGGERLQDERHGNARAAHPRASAQMLRVSDNPVLHAVKLWQLRNKSSRACRRKMFAHFPAQHFNEAGLHEVVVVRDEKADARFGRELLREFLPQPLLVPFLHHHDDIRPAQLAGGDFDARGVFSAGGADIPTRIAFENGFRRQAAPPVAAAHEKNFCALVGGVKNFFGHKFEIELCARKSN